MTQTNRNMDRRAYLISVFDDTLERINGDFELHKAQQQSVTVKILPFWEYAGEAFDHRFIKRLKKSHNLQEYKSMI